MSETQLKVTGTFQAADSDGNNHSITEYTLFRRTTTTDMSYSDGDGEEIKEYKLGNGAPVKKISETEFEIVSDGSKLRLLQ
jgi:hypothetical protein